MQSPLDAYINPWRMIKDNSRKINLIAFFWHLTIVSSVMLIIMCLNWHPLVFSFISLNTLAFIPSLYGTNFVFGRTLAIPISICFNNENYTRLKLVIHIYNLNSQIFFILILIQKYLVKRHDLTNTILCNRLFEVHLHRYSSFYKLT